MRKIAFRALSRLDFTDVEQVANPLYDPKGRVTLTSFDGLRVDLVLYQPVGTDDIWFSYKATYDLSTAEEGKAGIVEAAPNNGEAEAAQLNASAAGWLFKAASDLKEALIRDQEGYLVPLPQQPVPQSDGGKPNES